MNSISRQAIKVIAQAVSQIKGCSLDEVFTNSPLKIIEIEKKGRFRNWDLFVDWIHHLENQFAPLDWRKVGEYSLNDSTTPTLARIARMTMSVRFSYWIAATWYGPSQFAAVRCKFEDVDSNCIRETLELNPKLRGCPQLFRIFEGSLVAGPQWMFGLQKAAVNAKIHPHGATYDIALPLNPPLWRRLCTGLKNFIYFPNLFRELANQQSRLLAQSQIIENERSEFKNLIHNFPDGILIHRRGQILYTNSKLNSFLGTKNSSRWIGQKIHSFIAPEEWDHLENQLDSRNGFYKTYESNFIKEETQERVPVECIPVPFNFEGTPAVAVAVRDLTALKKLQSQAMMADRLRTLGQLAAGVGHEINNPLFFVQLKSSQLMKHLEGHDNLEAQKMVQEMAQGLRRIELIVKQLKTFSRAQEQQPPTLVSLVDVLQFAIQMAQPKIQPKVQLNMDFQDVPHVLGYESQLEQVFLNLLLNSVQAIEETSSQNNFIHVRVFLENDQVITEIEDSGKGIPEEIQSRIFQPFYTTKPVGEGTGLGLSICHTIISGYKGTISVDSKVGKGTTFRISMPVPAADLNRLQVAPSSPKPHLQSKILRRRVLILDDDSELLDVLKEMISEFHDTVALLDPRLALKRIQSGEVFDCIFCDLRMPEMDGPEFYKALIEISPHYGSKIFFLTGGSISKEHTQFLTEPGVRSLEKPIEVSQLLKVIQSLAYSPKLIASLTL